MLLVELSLTNNIFAPLTETFIPGERPQHEMPTVWWNFEVLVNECSGKRMLPALILVNDQRESP